MKKIYTVLLSALLAVAMLVGLWSLVDKDPTESKLENRRLAAKPAFSFSALWDGSYISQLETYYSDTFPGREMLLKANQLLNKFYFFSGSGDDNMLVVDFDNDVGQGGQAMKPQEPEGEKPAEKPVQPKPQKPEPKPEEPQTPPEPEINYDDMEYTKTENSIIIIGDNALDIPTGLDDIIDSYAQAMNNIQKAVAPQARTISIVAPNSGQFYSPTDYHTGVHDQKAMIERCYSGMNVDVISVDAYTPLEKHRNENVYFRTDHHWTALGAYYAYTAFCEAAGLEAVPLEDFKSGSYEGFVGSMYTWTSQYPQGQALKEHPDTLTYYLPLYDTQAAFFANGEMNNGEAYWIDVVNTNLPQDEYNKYMCFLAGDHPVVRITSRVDGPACVVLKDSYGNAFVPFLTSHYSTIYVIDPREFNIDDKPALDLVEFVKEHEVEDVISVNYSFMINNKRYVKLLNRLVGAES